MACGNESGACEEEEDACVCVCIQGSPLTLCLRRCLAPFSPLPSLPASRCLPLIPPSGQPSSPCQLQQYLEQKLQLFPCTPLGKQGGPRFWARTRGRARTPPLPNAGSLSLSPPSPDFCSLVSTSSPADCTKGKLTNANNKAQPSPSACPCAWVGCPHPLFRNCHQHRSARKSGCESNPPVGREGRRPPPGMQAGPLGRGAGHGGGSKGSAQQELRGLWRRHRDPLGAAAARVSRLCPPAPAQHPKQG